MPRRKRKIGGAPAWMGKVNDWLKKTKILSTIGSAITPMAGSFSPLAGRAIDYIKSKGYGGRRIRRRRRGGGALRPAGSRCCGGMLTPVGGSMARVRTSGRMSNRLIRPPMGRRMPAYH